MQTNLNVLGLLAAPLASATVVCRSQPQVDALGHVVQDISDYLDYSMRPQWTIPRTCSADLPWLLRRVLARFASKSSIDPLFREFVVAQGMANAVGPNGQQLLDMLFAHSPTADATSALECAAAAGNLEVLEWLRAHSSGLRPTQRSLDNAASSGSLAALAWLEALETEADAHSRLRIDDSAVLTSAAVNGHLEIVAHVLARQVGPDVESHYCAFDRAIAAGHVHVATYLFERECQHQDYPLYALNLFAVYGHLDALRTLQQAGKGRCSRQAMAFAARWGDLSALQWLHGIKKSGGACTASAMDKAAMNGQLEAIKWLHTNGSGGCTTCAMDGAAANGHLAIVQWLDANRSEGGTSLAIDGAASKGCLDAIEWLHAHRDDGCTVDAMNTAAANGHLAVVQWLHEHRTEGCTSHAMDEAAKYGHLDVVQWLHAHRREGCTVAAMNGAAGNGHLDVVQWLHANRSEGCTSKAMDQAAASNHLAVVQFLHARRREGCTRAAIDRAAGAGFLDVVRWLHANRTEGCSTAAMDWACSSGHFDVALFLHAHRREGCSEDAFVDAVMNRHVAISEWLFVHYRDTVDVTVLDDLAARDRDVRICGAVSVVDAYATLERDKQSTRLTVNNAFAVVKLALFLAMLFTHFPATDTMFQLGNAVSSTLAASGADTITTDSRMKFSNIATISDTFDWLTDTFVPSVFVTQDYNGDALEKDQWGRVAQFNKVLGAVLFNTARAQIHSCAAEQFLVDLYPNCYDADTVTMELELISFDTNATEATNIIQRLKARGDWLDFATQSLTITVVMYNGELQAYAVTELTIAYNQGGAAEPSFSTTPALSDPYADDAAYALDVLVALSNVLVLCQYVTRCMRQSRRERTRQAHAHRPYVQRVVATWWVILRVVWLGFYIIWTDIVSLMANHTFRNNLAQLGVRGKQFDVNSVERNGLLAATASLSYIASLTTSLRVFAVLAILSHGVGVLLQFHRHPQLGVLKRTITRTLRQFTSVRDKSGTIPNVVTAKALVEWFHAAQLSDAVARATMTYIRDGMPRCTDESDASMNAAATADEVKHVDTKHEVESNNQRDQIAAVGTRDAMVTASTVTNQQQLQQNASASSTPTPDVDANTTTVSAQVAHLVEQMTAMQQTLDALVRQMPPSAT